MFLIIQNLLQKTEDLYSESITSAYDDRLSWVKNATEIPSEKPMVDVTEPGSAKMSDHETTPLSGLSDKVSALFQVCFQ